MNSSTLELGRGLTVLYPMAIATTCDHGVKLHLNCGFCAWVENSRMLEEFRSMLDEMDHTLSQEAKCLFSKR